MWPNRRNWEPTGNSGALGRTLGCCALAVALTAPAISAPWQASLTPDAASPTPTVRPFEAEYRIGWTDIEAARARIKICRDPDRLRLEGAAETTGVARVLWQLDATINSSTSLPGLQTISTTQEEKYAGRSILTQIVARPDGIWRLRENFPPGENPARWKRIKLSPLRDLFSGMLFIRSQTLAAGETVSTVIFPGDAPFLVTIKSLGVETLTLAGLSREALKLSIELQRINLKKDLRLEPHGKFRTGTVWLSNDSDRIPLRAELQIFVGYVFAELESIRFNSP